MGDLAFILRPPLDSAIRHTLAFTRNFHEEHARSSFLARHTAHRQALRPYRKHLRGLSDVSLHGSCVGLSRVLAATALRDFKSRLIPDPDELLSEVEQMSSQYMELPINDSTDFGSLVAPFERGIDLCIRATSSSDVWIEVQSKASDPRAFVKKLISTAYQLLVLRQVSRSRFLEYFKTHHPTQPAYALGLIDFAFDVTPTMQTYEMCLVLAKRFRFPGWTADPPWEIQMNNIVAADIAMVMRFENRTGAPLAIGYKAAQRALELEPDDEESKKRMKWYDVRKRMAIQTSSFYNIVDGVLEDKGMTWWTGLRPESEYELVLAFD